MCRYRESFFFTDGFLCLTARALRCAGGAKGLEPTEWGRRVLAMLAAQLNPEQYLNTLHLRPRPASRRAQNVATIIRTPATAGA